MREVQELNRKLVEENLKTKIEYEYVSKNLNET